MTFFDPEYLWIVLILFVIFRTVIVLYGREWFSKPLEAGEVKHTQKERSNNLTLAGFALAAIALFLTLGANPNEQPLPQVSDTTFYLSISLVSFITAAYFYNFATSRYFSYLSDSLEFLGLLSVGAAMLVFFDFMFPSDNRIEFVYYMYFIAVIVISAKEFGMYVKYLKNLKPSPPDKK